MHRFQVAREDVGEKSLLVKGQQAIHLTRVLRLGIGAELFAFDNSGFEYRVRVSELRGDEVLCEIVTRVESKSEPPLDVFLIQGLPKSDKMELIIQKTTELGIKAIYPVRTTRAVVRLEGTKAGAKVERWQKIAVEAAKQCGRSLAPEVKQVMDLAVALQALPQDTRIIAAYEAERVTGLREALAKWHGESIALIVGPEGGFAPEEVALLARYGAVSVSLGPRILRTETAGLAALTMVLYEHGDLGTAITLND